MSTAALVIDTLKVDFPFLLHAFSYMQRNMMHFAGKGGSDWPAH